MINISEVSETNAMIEKENLDVRTITMGISLMDCIDSDLQVLRQKIYDKIYKSAANLVKVGEEISTDYGIPIVNKRISVTPVALVGGSACHSPEDFAQIAVTLDKAAHDVGVNFLGGYSALVSKGMTKADKLLIESIPQALQRRLDKDRHRYGRGPHDGKDHQGDGGENGGQGLHRLREARRIL